jgi:hypothetical protein
MADFIRAKAHRNYLLVFIGPGGSGSTFMALNCAAHIYAAGFSVAFIDGDLTGHSAQYLTKLGITGDVLAAEARARSLRPGFDMYGATQFKSSDGRNWQLNPALVQHYDFTVADIPFSTIQQATGIILSAARIAVTVDSSNWGIGKAARSLFNIPIDLEPVLKSNARLIYNRSDKLSAGLFGSVVKDETSIKNKVDEIFGARGSLFISLPAVSIVGSYTSAEDSWFSNTLFSDSAEGSVLFDGVLRGLLINATKEMYGQ